MVLLHAMHHAGFDIMVAHVNYGLRDEDSNQDEALVLRFCEENQVPCHVYKVSTADWKAVNGSIQMKARKIRYQFFQSIMVQHQLNKVLTAHHAEDQAETILMNLIRGSGVQGLKGMSAKRGRLVRPLLNITKEEIASYAIQHQVPWREDQSNQSNKYRRNRIRNEVFPILKSMIPTITKSIVRSGEHIQSDAYFAQVGLQFLERKVSKSSNEGISIDIPLLQRISFGRDLLYHLILPFGFNSTDANDLWSALGHVGAEKLAGSYKAVVDRDKLMVSTVNSVHFQEYILDKKEGSLSLPNGSLLQWKKIIAKDPMQFPVSPDHVWLDASKLSWPLTVRVWRAGDKFVPLGMQGQQKVSDLLINRKINILDKAKTMVLCSDSDIFWILGHRLGSKAAIDPHTTEIIEFLCSSNG